MDSSRINEVFEELYIPNSEHAGQKKVPPVVPSLIMQDRSSDATHHLKCGCCPDACIHEKAWWGPASREQRPSLVTARTYSWSTVASDD